MPARFTVLASGSHGNASLLQVDGYGLLLDIGLGPRQLAARLSDAQSSWDHIHGVLLTHTHSDHWNTRTLAHLTRRRIPLYCHSDHARFLRRSSVAFRSHDAEGLVRTYEAGGELWLRPSVRCRVLPVRHDGGATFGFRLDGTPNLFGSTWSIAYLSDLGTWDEALAAALLDLDLLALEFNHDVALEQESGRAPWLIARVLGEEGHLSNDQAASLLREILTRPGQSRLRHIVQLHLSRECNRPLLAMQAAHAVVQELGLPIAVEAASQDVPSLTYHLGYPEPDVLAASGEAGQG